MTIKSYATKWNRPEDNNFATACYDDNTIDELTQALEDGVDATDCETWDISETEWVDAIEAAIVELKSDEGVQEMKKFKSGYYQADTVNGVHFVGNDLFIDTPDAEIMPIRDFIDSLDTLGDSEIIWTSIEEYQEEIWNEINNEYGIR